MTLEPLTALKSCHKQLRRADFDLRLLELVRANDAIWMGLTSDDNWLQGRSVAAEVYDYFGDYLAAQKSLDPADRRIQNVIDPLHDQLDELHKRRIWVAIAFAHARYRLEDYKSASFHLDRCRDRLNRADPTASRFFGTRARLAYSLGQVARQQQHYDAALRQFAEVCHFAAERLREKTSFLELVGPPRAGLPALSDKNKIALERERLLASWTIGKSLAFGVGWIHYTTGNLRGASVVLNTGYSLLRCTGDWIHRAYAQLLLAATERARGGDDRGRVERATARVQESEEGLSQHPAFRGRASYERAISLLHAGNPSGALQIIHKVRRSLSDGPASVPTGVAIAAPKTTRWTCNLLVLESRALRQLGKRSEALAAAGLAIDKAAKSGEVTSRIEALIARVDAFLETDTKASLRATGEAASCARDDLRLALRLLEAHPNPKMEAACWLHLARAHRLAGNTEEARKAFGVWIHEYADRVEHAFLHDLARSIGRDIGAPEARFVLSSTIDNLNAAQHGDRLQAFLIRAAAERSRTAADQAALLGVSERTLRDWITKLGDKFDVGKRLGQ